MTRRARAVGVGIVVVLFAVPMGGSAQDAVARAQMLYQSARYEDALSVLEQADTSSVSAFAFGVLRYRALCFMALGRPREAEQAIAALVDLDPFYAPDAREVAPRVVQAFNDVRRARLPAMVRALLVGARQALHRHDSIESDRLLLEASQLLREPVLATRPDIGDLRLASETLAELGRLQHESASLVTDSAAPAVPRAEPDGPPFPLMQTFPAWEPSESSVARREFDGAVRVAVDATGRVASAAIERPTYPPYDRALLAAAREWRYRPARKGGTHVPADLLVEYALRPPMRWQIYRTVR